MAFTTAPVITVVSILNALGAFALLVSGFKNYVALQRWMMAATAVAFLTTLIVLFFVDPATVPDKLNAFSVAVGGSTNYYQGAIDAATAKGIGLNPTFSILATLLVAPIAWTSLQWATYSAEQNGEIKDAKSFKTQAFIYVGGLTATGIALALLGAAFQGALGTQFLQVAGAGLLVRSQRGQYRRLQLVAPDPGGCVDREPDRGAADRSRVPAQQLPDRQQHHDRHDPNHRRGVARPRHAGVVQQGA